MLDSVLILLAVSVVVLALFRRVNIPTVLAYVLVGILIGPKSLGWVSNDTQIHYIAEFGLVFLLFTIGLEFSLPQMISLRRAVFGLGGGQVLVTGALLGLIAWLLGVSGHGALIMGGILAMSSTAIVTKLLADQLELSAPHSRTTIGVLLFQDLAVIPLLVLIPIFSKTALEHMFVPVSLALLKAAAVLVLMLAVGRWLLRPIFYRLVMMRSPELFILTVLLASIGAAWLTNEVGLSYELGAFVAGMTLGETEFKHQVEADIRPFQDVLLGLFFITTGMMVDIHVLLDYWPWILAATLALMLFKWSVVVGLGGLLRFNTMESLRAGVLLAQGGEFGFVLLALGSQERLFPDFVAQIALSIILLSMVFSAFLIRYNGAIAKFLADRLGPQDYSDPQALPNNIPIHEHIVICGYGRVGQNLARFLDQEKFPYIALDLDPVRIREARQAGERVMYGDASRREILEAAGLKTARLLVISFDDHRLAFKILDHVLKSRPEMPVLVRTRDDTYLDELLKAGATEVVPETLEASLMLSSHVLLLLGMPVSRIFRNLRTIRSSRYKLMRGIFMGEEKVALDAPDMMRARLHAVTLSAPVVAKHKTLADLGLAAAEVMVTAVNRKGLRNINPTPEMVLMEGDVLVLYGAPEALEHIEARLLLE